MKQLCNILIAGLLFVMDCAHLKEAEQNFNAGQYWETIRLCQSAISEDSSDVKAYSLMGQTYFVLNKPDSSLSTFKKAFSLAPENSFYKDRIFVLYKKLGDKYFVSEKYFKAIEHYELALKYTLSPDSVIIKIGDSYYNAGKHDKAFKEYSMLSNSGDAINLEEKIAQIETAKEQAQKYLAAGKIFIQKRQYDKAKKQFLKALELKPDFIEAQYHLHMATGLRLYRKGAKNTLWDAIEEFGYAASIYPQLGEPHYYMAMSYNKKDKNEYDNAISEFELAIQVEPNGKFAGESKKKIIELKTRRKKMREFLSR